MRLVTVLAALIFAFIAAITSTHAQGRGNGQAKRSTASASKAKAQTPKQTAKADTRAAKRTAKADTRAAKTTAKANTRAARAESKAARKTGTTTTTTTPTDVTPTTPMTKQDARLLLMLPPGTNIQEASQGFKNRGQFIAAVNASNNHGIPFADLKARMTGIAPGATVATTTPMSLGQAMQSFKVTPPTPIPPPTTPTP
jgi:hypothetical protein